MRKGGGRRQEKGRGEDEKGRGRGIEDLPHRGFSEIVFRNHHCIDIPHGMKCYLIAPSIVFFLPSHNHSLSLEEVLSNRPQ